MATGSDGTEEKRIPLFDLKTPKRDIWRTLGLMLIVFIISPCPVTMLYSPFIGDIGEMPKHPGIIQAIIYGAYAFLAVWSVVIIFRLLIRLRKMAYPRLPAGLLVSICALVFLFLSWLVTMFVLALHFFT